MSMKFTFSEKPGSKNLLVFFSEEGWKKEKGPLKERLGKDFTGKSLQTAKLYDTEGFRRTILIGIGNEKDADAETLRKASNTFALMAKTMKMKDVHVDIKRGFSKKIESAERGILEGIILGQYEFLKYKKKEKGEEVVIEKATFGSKPEGKEAGLRKAVIAAENTLIARDLVNSSSDEINPVAFEKFAEKIAKEKNIKMTVLNEKELKSKGLNLLMAVNRGSRFPARLVIMEYSGGKKEEPLTAVVGKGITFDSGGINIKPSGYLESMRTDMAGAAAALGIIKTLAEWKSKKNIIAVMALTENMIGSCAYKPGDVFTAYNGKTVEIRNTDAEGRLVLADAVAYTEKNFRPDMIIDLATLTGAVVVCLGELAAGIISNDEKKALELQKISFYPEIYERAWMLPSLEECKDVLKSDIADLGNMGFPKSKAETITGGLFIGEFAGDTPWIHLDIAGTADISERRNYNTKTGTGFGVRLVSEFIERTKIENFRRKKK